MTNDRAFMSRRDVDSLFSADAGHVPVALRRMAGAKLLWVNARAMQDDPEFMRCVGDVGRYEERLLDACAFRLLPAGGVYGGLHADRADASGFADRYGGGRIGSNGGSGRAAVVNGYLVKGIGRTALVSALTEEAHSSGGAYLEECVREAVFSEVAAAEFPAGAVPVLAIIDTGDVQVWDTALGPKSERCVLLVWPAVLRPAHFERAAGFVSGYEREGSLDTRRVERMFAMAADLEGVDALVARYRALWPRWARQIAHGFVHRLPHGSDSTSNIALDGRLMDFGGMTAVPSWGAAATMLYPVHEDQQLSVLTFSIRAVGHHFGRYLGHGLGTDAERTATVAEAINAYRAEFLEQTLRLCGVTPEVARDAAASPGAGQLLRAVMRTVSHFQRETLDLIESTPVPRIRWDLARVWDRWPPTHLVRLRGIVDDLVPASRRAQAQVACVALSRDRPLLYGREMRDRLYDEVDARPAPDPASDRRRIADTIEAHVAGSRLATHAA